MYCAIDLYTGLLEDYRQDMLLHDNGRMQVLNRTENKSVIFIEVLSNACFTVMLQ